MTYNTPEDFDTYHGNLYSTTFNQIQCLRAVPQSSGHFRTQTRDHFNSPYRASWWVFPEQDLRLPENPKAGAGNAPERDGLHIHFNSFSNELNFNINAVRRDGNAKLDYEKGAHEYLKLGWREGGGLPLQIGHYYFFTLDVSDYKASLQVGSSYYSTKGVELAWDLPRFANKSGAIGFRFDNIQALIGGLTITP